MHETDVEQRRQGHGQREQQRPDALGRLDETQTPQLKAPVALRLRYW